MLITKKVQLSWMPAIKDYFVDKGYVFTKYREKFEVIVDDLLPNSQAIIHFTCDYCSKELINNYYKYYKSLNNFPPIPKVCCSNCRYIKNKEILVYKNEHNLLKATDNGYFNSKKNRIFFIKSFIENNGDLRNLTSSKDGWRIIRFQQRFKDDLVEIVEELGYKYYEMVSLKNNYYDNFSILEKNIKELIEKIGRFPSYNEILKELKCTDQFIAMHGGMVGIVNKMNYNTDKELIDDSGYYNQSSYEYIVAQFLLNNNISYKRNQNPFPDSEKNFMSDFAIYPKFSKEVHIEVWGLGTDEYQETKIEKQKLYNKYSNNIELISLEKSLFRKRYDSIQSVLINKLGKLLDMDLLQVENDYIIPKVLSDNEILEELLRYSEDKKTLPKYEDLRGLRKEKLFDEAVKRYGSYMAFASKYNLKTHGKTKGFWNEKEVFEQLAKVVETFGSVSTFTSSKFNSEKTTDFKGLIHYIRKIGARKTKLNFFLHCQENGIPINEEDVEYIRKTEKLTHEKHANSSALAKLILDKLN